jgi:hypothetical protein
MNNDFETTYASWPFRYYIVKNNKFLKIGMPFDSEFDFGELLDFLHIL